MAETIRFSEREATLLWALPKDGSDLAYLVRILAFIERDAVAPYGFFREAVSRAVRAGVVSSADGVFQVAPEWYDCLHQFDAPARIPEDSIAELAEFLGNWDWPCPCSPDLEISVTEYEQAVAKANSR